MEPAAACMHGIHMLNFTLHMDTGPGAVCAALGAHMCCKGSPSADPSGSQTGHSWSDKRHNIPFVLYFSEHYVLTRVLT